MKGYTFLIKIACSHAHKNIIKLKMDVNRAMINVGN
jgi:hypothetical protein